MSKVRVYEVAREVGLPNRELVQKIAALGIAIVLIVVVAYVLGMLS